MHITRHCLCQVTLVCSVLGLSRGKLDGHGSTPQNRDTAQGPEGSTEQQAEFILSLDIVTDTSIYETKLTAISKLSIVL